MILEFLESWTLFSRTYISALLIGASLSLMGVVVVARGNIFVAAAVAQASMLGVALSLFFGIGQPVLSAVFCSVGASLLIARKHQEGGASTSEEMTGWIFLVGGSFSVLLLARMPYGLKEIQSLFSSSIIGASSSDIIVFGILLFIFVGFLVIWSRRLTLYLSDPVMASAVGSNIFLWSIGIASSLGLATGLAIRSSGMLFTFGAMVLPAQMAKIICRNISGMFLVAPVVALLSIMFGLVLGNYYDLPPAQTVVALMCFLLLVTWIFRWIYDAVFLVRDTGMGD
ncbi:MAG: metal ABC transporter permease [Verrucomicrobiota bacterium]|nr:metal ABC transporter permease [Verrucomicrobiota bacterium]